MRLFQLATVGLAALSGIVQGDAVQDLVDKGRPAIDAYMKSTSKNCTAKNLRVRKEW